MAYGQVYRVGGGLVGEVRDMEASITAEDVVDEATAGGDEDDAVVEDVVAGDLDAGLSILPSTSIWSMNSK